MTTVKFVDLRADRRLLKTNFDGYKLSLDPVPTIKHELTSSPLQAKPTDEQYSYLHAELFSLHNHLVQDPWDTLSVYFITVHGSLQKCTYDQETGRPRPPAAVYQLPSMSSRQPGDYNVSFKFLSEKYCLLSDGCNQILLIDTGDRCRSAEWKVVFKTNVTEERKNFVIRDARLDITAEEKRINFVLHRIEHEEGERSVTELHWFVIVQSPEKIWSLEHKGTFGGKGSINYCALEPKAGALVLSSNQPFKAISAVDTDDAKVETQADGGDGQVARESYTWVQTDEDITIKFACRPDANKFDYKVTCSKDHLQVKCKEDVLLDSALFSKVDTDLTTWTLENNFLQITIIKDVTSLHWPFLIAGGPSESIDTQKDCVMPVGQPVSNLEAQMEECDEPMQSIEAEFYIDRIDLATRKPTHRISLGSRAPLFAACLRPGFPAAIVTRQDVDACLWLQQVNPSRPEEWSLRHEGTLHALGYVEASKQQKKFVNCSPDMSYAVICESHRHIFIYKSTYDTANALRNRNGPQVSIGKQHLVTLEDAGEVLGLAIDNSVTFILTEKLILYLQINVE